MEVGVLSEGNSAREFMKLSAAEFTSYGFELFRRDARGENIVAVLSKAGEDRSEVGRSFARAEDDFRHTHAQRAVVIDVGEAQVFEGQVLQLLHRLIGRELFLANLLE